MDTPDVAGIAGLIGDRARARMLADLLSGNAYTATELARAAGVSKQTASAHLSRLVDGQLVVVESQGRNRYFRLAAPDVGRALESLMGIAQRIGGAPIPTGPADPALRKARVCYDHLAGDVGVMVYDRLVETKALRVERGAPAITGSGEQLFAALTIDCAALRRRRRAFCLACLDWSERRHHLAGSLGTALLDRILALKWARRVAHSRTIVFSALGERGLRDWLAQRPV